jgi:NAD+ diphosphatase
LGSRVLIMSRESIYKRYVPEIACGPADDEPAYWFIFSGNRLLVESEGTEVPFLKSPAQLGLSPVRRQFLGRLDGHPCFSAETAHSTEAPAGASFRDLRSLYGILEEDVYLLAGKAVQVVNWDRTHQFCGRCGHPTQSLPGEMAKVCPECGFTSYPRLSPATITAVVRGDKILLAHYAAFRGNIHTVIAGFVEPGETLEECVRREVFEEVGVRVKNIRYFGSQPWPYPNSLMVGFTAEYASGEISVDRKEISYAGWYGADSLPELPGELSIARELIDWFVRDRSGGD